MTGTGAALPRASDKAEGVLMQAKLVPGRHGSLTLMRNVSLTAQFSTLSPCRAEKPGSSCCAAALGLVAGANWTKPA